MKEINIEFKEWRNVHETLNSEHVSKTESNETPEEFINIISKLCVLSGIGIEICGTWIWISGNTYPVKHQLKDFGCRFASKKLWYWTESETYSTKKTMSMEENKNQI